MNAGVDGGWRLLDGWIAGVAVNSLELGYDCLGHIKDFDGVVNNAKGAAPTTCKAICLLKEDACLLWKHTVGARRRGWWTCFFVCWLTCATKVVTMVMLGFGADPHSWCDMCRLLLPLPLQQQLLAAGCCVGMGNLMGQLFHGYVGESANRQAGRQAGCPLFMEAALVWMGIHQS